MTQDASLQFELTTNLLRIGRIWRKHVRAHINTHGISEACAHPLLAIGRLGNGVRQGPVAEEVGMEGPSLVRLLDQLCECGFVERREDPADRRAKTLWLTERGSSVMANIEGDLVALRAQVLAAVSNEDIEATLRVFAAFKAFQPAPENGSESIEQKREETA